jgi:hypothetical protein
LRRTSGRAINHGRREAQVRDPDLAGAVADSTTPFRVFRDRPRAARRAGRPDNRRQERRSWRPGVRLAHRVRRWRVRVGAEAVWSAVEVRAGGEASPAGGRQDRPLKRGNGVPTSVVVPRSCRLRTAALRGGNFFAPKLGCTSRRSKLLSIQLRMAVAPWPAAGASTSLRAVDTDSMIDDARPGGRRLASVSGHLGPAQVAEPDEPSPAAWPPGPRLAARSTRSGWPRCVGGRGSVPDHVPSARRGRGR